MRGYELLEHTADIGLRVRGKDIEEIFIYAAEGMFAIIAGTEGIETREEIKIECEAEDIEELLVNWLSELLYCFNVKRILGKEFFIEKLEENRVKGGVKGEEFDEERHLLLNEIKGVTYHNLRIEKKGEMWEAEVIFDV
ncbi:MAG: archease [Candidatus Omnitrophota bacterium]|nr:MAG: archease [Candidatus Omnitrophota bacterium]